MNLRQANNFDFLRFCAAALVLFSHTFPLTTGSNASEPLYQLTNHGATLGRVAVAIFFIISGFLISGSWHNKGELRPYLTARLLRIIPGLAVVLLLTVLAGRLLTLTPELYWPSAVKYVVKNLTLYKMQFGLAGVFGANPYGDAINGALWTLRHEFTCYLLVAGLGLLRRNSMAIAWGVWLLAAVLSTVPALQADAFFGEFLPLLGWFYGGTLAFVYRERKWSPVWYALALLAMGACAWAGINLVWLAPLLGCLLIQLAYLPGLLNRFGRYGDFSYGMYIYAFPVQQYLVYRDPGMVWWQNLLLAFPIVLVCSALSWHLVEKRCLKLKSALLLPTLAGKGWRRG
jgi:peptidoglycan/LPS O-acetylase OafA/YrhL